MVVSPEGVLIPGSEASKPGVTEQAKAGRVLRERALNYINPEDLTTAPPEMTEGEAMAKGYRPFNGKSGGQFITMSRYAFSLLDRFRELSVKLLPKSTGDKTKDAINVRANQVRLAALNQARDPDVREFFALRESNLAQLAKAAGDAANIAVPEQEFQKKALPSGSDTQESALRLLDSKYTILRGTVASALGVRPIPKNPPGQNAPAQGGTPVEEYVRDPKTGKLVLKK